MPSTSRLTSSTCTSPPPRQALTAHLHLPQAATTRRLRGPAVRRQRRRRQAPRRRSLHLLGLQLFRLPRHLIPHLAHREEVLRALRPLARTAADVQLQALRGLRSIGACESEIERAFGMEMLRLKGTGFPATV